MHDEKPTESKKATEMRITKRFINTYLSSNKFERKNCISKICRMTTFHKPLMTVVLLALVFAVSAQTAQTIKSLDNTIYLSKQINGLNAFIVPQPAAGNVQITFYIKTGTVYENDSVSGVSYILQNIISDKIANYLRKNKSGISFQNTSLVAYTTTELSVFQLTSSPANYPACLQLLRDSIYSAPIYEDELQNKIETVRKEIADEKNNYKTVFETKLQQRLYRKDANKQILIGDTSGSFPFMDVEHVQSFHAKYYVSNNTLVNAIGNIDLNQFQNKLAEVVKGLHKAEFDPETIIKIVDFKPMVYTTQFVVNSPIEQPQLEICWQFPGTRSNEQSSYYAFLLSAMLNDQNNFIQVKARKLGCKKFTAVYEASNFSGVFKIILQPDKQHFFETYNFVIKELLRLDKTLVNESMMKVGMLNFQKEYNNIKSSKDYVGWVTKYWIYNDETYFSTVRDSVFSLGETKMRKFVIEYINQSSHVTGLMVNETDRNDLKVDSLLPDLDPTVNEYVFHYRPNITDLEGTDNLNMQNNLLQWLTINPDIVVQINGCADRSEFGKTKDDSIRAFIDSIPTFAKVRQELVKAGSLRPEMMRAMKIIKYLYDHGIEPERLKGTSMPFSSKNIAEELANMKCTLTMEKIRKAPSVYEYHYGKRRE